MMILRRLTLAAAVGGIILLAACNGDRSPGNPLTEEQIENLAGVSNVPDANEGNNAAEVQNGAVADDHGPVNEAAPHSHE